MHKKRPEEPPPGLFFAHTHTGKPCTFSNLAESLYRGQPIAGAISATSDVLVAAKSSGKL